MYQLFKNMAVLMQCGFMVVAARKLYNGPMAVRVFNASMLSMQNSITTLTSAANGHYKNGTVIYREQ